MIKIFYFAFLRERAGISEEDVALPKNVTVQQDAPVKAGDEVAFFPPVTGG
jgi:molybdopterin converting factor small subunit